MSEPPSTAAQIKAYVTCLPVEILIRILSYQYPRQIVKCRLISKRFNEIIDETPLFLYLIELEKSGFEDGPQSRLNLAERLGSLRAAQNTWRDPRPRVSVKRSLRLPYVAGGENRYTKWSSHSEVIVRQTFSEGDDGPLTRIDLIRLLDVVDGATQFEFEIVSLAFDCSDLYVDLEQQLMVVYENTSPLGSARRRSPDKVHLLSVVNGQPHPKAQQKIVNLPHPEKGCRVNGRVRAIIGSFIFIWFSTSQSNRSYVCLYHWPTWCHVKTWSSMSFCILPMGLILVMGVNRLPGGTRPFFQAWALPESDKPWDPILRATFELPLFSEKSPVQIIFNEAGMDSTLLKRDHDFSSPDPALIVLSIPFDSLVIPVSALLEVCDYQPGPTAEVPVCPWAMWGRKAFFGDPIPPRFAIWGYRIIFQNVIWDFTPQARGLSAVSGCKSSYHLSRESWGHAASITLGMRRIRRSFPIFPDDTRFWIIETDKGPMYMQKHNDFPHHLNDISVEIVSL